MHRLLIAAIALLRLLTIVEAIGSGLFSAGGGRNSSSSSIDAREDGPPVRAEIGGILIPNFTGKPDIYVFVTNEYKGARLVRQSACPGVIEKRPMLVGRLVRSVFSCLRSFSVLLLDESVQYLFISLFIFSFFHAEFPYLFVFPEK